MSMSTEEIERRFSKLRTADEELSQDGEKEQTKESAKESLDDSITEDEARSLKAEGNTLYKAGDYTAAAEKYARAARSAHVSDEERAVFLANRAAASLKMQKFSDVVADATEALKLKPSYVKAVARRKEAHERLGDWSAALEDAKTLGADEGELTRLRIYADEKKKRDTQEALDSLKGLGNSILSNIGMSLDDFAFEKDANTGSYNIKMKK